MLTVHEDVDEQDLHYVEPAAQPEHRVQRDERERRRGGAKLERQEVWVFWNIDLPVIPSRRSAQ